MEIDAWARLSGVSLRPWEFNLLTALDEARIEALSAPKDAAPPVSERTMSPDLFGALFG